MNYDITDEDNNNKKTYKITSLLTTTTTTKMKPISFLSSIKENNLLFSLC